jgi:hypothetical protein
MRNNLKIGVISVIGLLTLTVISAMTINSLSVVKAEPYGQLVSREAQKDDSQKGFGEEVSPLAKDGGMKEFREAGVPARGGDNAPGQSGQDHGNDD